MKRLKRIMALVIAMAMVLGMTTAAFASSYGASNEHTITITNTDQNVSHTYKGYQVFSGNLDSKEMTLSDIQWGSGVNGDTLLAALKASTDPALKAVAGDLTEGKDALGESLAVGDNIFKNANTAADVAKILATFQSTGQKYGEDGKPTTDTGVNDNAGRIDAVATIIGEGNGVLKGEGFGFTESEKEYTASVTGDGYYFIKDVTPNESLKDDDTTASDTKSKYLLSVVKDVTIVAKDTGLTPDKKIRKDATTTVAANSSAIGDTVNFEVTVEVPNTKKYEKDFWFVMNDKLPAGITFTGITSVMIDTTEVKDIVKENATAIVTSNTYDGSNGYYTLATGAAAASVANVALATSADDPDTSDSVAVDTTKYKFEQAVEIYDPVKEVGGQAIRLTFNEFKKFVEKNNLIGKTITIKYTGVVNDDAEYKATENENEVTFTYSNDPNHDYDGDNPGSGDDEVTGTTPEAKTRTYTTSIKILKVDENGNPLKGAEFTLTGDNLNRTVVTGTKFVPSTYELPDNGEAFEQASSANVKYWKLKDGSYTATDPTTVQNTTQYDSTDTFYYKVIYTFDELAPNETKSPLVVTTDDNGVAEFVGLNAGTYTLEETHSPEGYNKLDGTSTITITWEDPTAVDTTDLTGDDLTAAQAKIAQGGFTLTATSIAEELAWNATDKQYEVTIENMSGSVLPSTGGIGTTIFYVVGAILVIGAGVVLITRRRMDA